MKILIVGLGVIGSTYGYLFQAAGHETEHMIRSGSIYASTHELSVSLLDGRRRRDGEMSHGVYSVKQTRQGEAYDFIFVSVPGGKIADVLRLLQQQNIRGTILLACGIWENHEELDRIMEGWDYIIGYPVAGGSRKNASLNCCVFDHFMMENRKKSAISNYDLLEKLFADCAIQLETPHDMLEWIWIHMAVNAGVVSTAGKYGDAADPQTAAENLMSSSKALAEAVLAIRETLRIISVRKIHLQNYKNEVSAYRIPHRLAGIIMKRMFAKNLLTRKIMTLHSNMDDLLFVCARVYELGRGSRIDAPVFYENYEAFRAKLLP